MTNQDKEWCTKFAAGFPPYMTPNGQVDRARVKAALAQYEQARMAARPKPKFILEIKDSHFYAKPSRGTIWDAVIVAVTGACWFGLLFSLYLVLA